MLSEISPRLKIEKDEHFHMEEEGSNTFLDEIACYLKAIIKWT